MSPVAICICTCDRTHLLARVLHALESIELGEFGCENVVLIVVDNRPDGRVRSLCESMRSRLPMTLHVVEEQQRGISFARNRGVREALALGAGFVAFIDDDDLPRPDWLLHLLRTQHETGADLVFGLWSLPNDLPLPCWLRNTRYFRPPRREDRNRFGLPGWAGTYNVLISRHALEMLDGPEGPFRAEFAHCGGEDSDLFIRAKHAGLSHACAYDSIVLRIWETHRLTLRGILRRGFQRGGSRVHIARAHLPAEQVRGLVWASWRKLGKALLRLTLTGWRRSRLVGSLLALAHSLGEIYAWTGMRYSFYLRRPDDGRRIG
ncbi:glycosyltransferase family 2 protein [Benzoatithermus flavus]|uniref:Glycosyltransferase n=1 Tax=Benzoatithermus flavus TaxID=3108223 RepID=A0ABU8XWQ7_9PROT